MSDIEFTPCVVCNGDGVIEKRKICDECGAPGEMMLEPYYKEIHELFLVKCLCNKCRTESIDNI